MGYSLVPLFSTVKILKQKDKSHLPDLFPFPKYYRPDVEACLEAKRFADGARANFYSSIACAMFTYKRSLTSAEFVSIARELFEKYTLLASVGDGTTFGSRTYIYLIYSVHRMYIVHSCICVLYIPPHRPSLHGNLGYKCPSPRALQGNIWAIRPSPRLLDSAWLLTRMHIAQQA